MPAFAQSIKRQLKRVNTTTEQARREALIFLPIDRICALLDCSINIEYTVSASNWLKGSLNYYISSLRNLLVVEAKQADLTKGFTQLAVELIALDRWVESESSILYGAVSTGEIWQLGLYPRSTRQVVEYLPLHPIPQDVEFVTRTILGILQGEELRESAQISSS